MKYKNWLFKWAANVQKGSEVYVDISELVNNVQKIIDAVSDYTSKADHLGVFLFEIFAKPSSKDLSSIWKHTSVTPDDLMRFHEWKSSRSDVISAINYVHNFVESSSETARLSSDFLEGFTSLYGTPVSDGQGLRGVVLKDCGDYYHIRLVDRAFPDTVKDDFSLLPIPKNNVYPIAFGEDNPESYGRKVVEEAAPLEKIAAEFKDSKPSIEKNARWTNCASCRGQEQIPRCMDCDGCGRMLLKEADMKWVKEKLSGVANSFEEMASKFNSPEGQGIRRLIAAGLSAVMAGILTLKEITTVVTPGADLRREFTSLERDLRYFQEEDINYKRFGTKEWKAIADDFDRLSKKLKEYVGEK